MRKIMSVRPLILAAALLCVVSSDTLATPQAVATTAESCEQALLQLGETAIELSLLPADQRQAELRQAADSDRQLVLHWLETQNWQHPEIVTLVQSKVGDASYRAFLERFGIHRRQIVEQSLELRSQLQRAIRIAEYNRFQTEFDAGTTTARVTLLSQAREPRQLHYALRAATRAEFEQLLAIVIRQRDASLTDQDRQLIEFLQSRWKETYTADRPEEARKWQAVLAQIATASADASECFGFSRVELFAMLRNTERTLAQRTRPFLDFSPEHNVPEEFVAEALRLCDKTRPDADSSNTLVLFDVQPEELTALSETLSAILNNKDAVQTEQTRASLLSKYDLLDPANRVAATTESQPHHAAHAIAEATLERLQQPYRKRFVRGLALIRKSDTVVCRLLESFPMIVAGDTYPYQWKHDNEVNIALLLANVDPVRAAQAVRFIVYHGMWRSARSRQLGLYGWLPQIIFGNRQNGQVPSFGGKKFYYFPDFRFRPTRDVDAENERNRTSEIAQLPFFGWTVFRVWENLRQVDAESGDAFLQEMYPFVSANTSAMRTALDPFDEGVLSGRDAWVNGMDNGWYHLAVMNRHLPRRAIPAQALEIVNANRVDNRLGKQPGMPVDPVLAKGRPSDFYYASKVVFYDLAAEVGLSPQLLYHASPYNVKDVAITGVMAQAIRSQLRMARRMGEIHAGKGSQKWTEEVTRLEWYLSRMRQSLDEHCWSDSDGLYCNVDVTAFVPGLAERLFCRPRITSHGIRYQPRDGYWSFDPDHAHYVPSRKARAAGVVDFDRFAINLDLDGTIHYEILDGKGWSIDDSGPTLLAGQGVPFLPEQYCVVDPDSKDKVVYRLNPRYWDKTDSGWVLNEHATQLTGRGARLMEQGDRIPVPAIASFFPLFGEVPSEDRAFSLVCQLVDPMRWWPVDGIPFPSQPFAERSEDGSTRTNPVYDADRYWQGPTWMSATKPIADGIHSYGYQQLYSYVMRRSIETLQEGRAVEHWNAETGAVNTTNINFPWAASCMAGAIWSTLSPEEQAEYLDLWNSSKR